METHRRSLAKAATYRLFATSLVFLIAFLFTGRFRKRREDRRVGGGHEDRTPLPLGAAVEPHHVGVEAR
jgi:hypothetical protein